MKTQEDLLNRYFSGETSTEEEAELRKSVLADEDSAEKDMMEYFSLIGKVPENLEEQIFISVTQTQAKNRTLKMQFYRFAAVAAVLAVVITAYFGFRSAENKRLEKQFFVMEQALSQVSKSIEPQEQEEMIVLWVDNDVEIIIN
ncbi:MAG: hypothetical protein AB7S72_13900 [Draconibacterium sp.]